MASWTWPVPTSNTITSGYGYRGDIGLNTNPQHNAIDISAPYGTPIVAANDGTVVESGFTSGYGQWIVIEHEGGVYSTYAHMQTRKVEVGDSVKAGDLIAEVGSEGKSTGPHLHFQIETGGYGSGGGGTPVNPLNYVSTSGVANIEYLLDSLSGKDFGEFYDPAETKVYPETVSGASLQPLMPFVEFVVGGQSLTLLPPRHIIGFEFTKSVEDESHLFNIQIFDDNWEEVEYLCSNNQENVQLRYGYATGNHSKTYDCTLQKYSINFNSTGVLLDIQGMTKGPTDNLQNLYLDTHHINPTEAAKIICREAGWQVHDENFHPSIGVRSYTKDSFSMVNERPATYIITKLAPLAVDAEGNGGFRFFLDESTTPPTAYFRPIHVADNTRRTYVYMKGVDSPVIDLQLTVNGVWGGNSEGRLVTTGESSVFIDPETKEEHKASEVLNSTENNIAVGEYSHTSGSQYHASIDAAGSSPEEMAAILKYRVQTGYIPYEGFLTIVGDPTIDLIAGDSTIRLLIIDDFGYLHHTSGLYMVKAITDTISGGVMTTNLHIFRSEDIMTGVELVNYRKLLE